MTHNEFIKKYQPVPSNATWILRDMIDPNHEKPIAILAVVVMDGHRVPGIILTNRPNEDIECSRFFKMNPYIRDNIIDFDIIDEPYDLHQIEFIDEDFTMDVFDFCIKEIMGDQYPAKQ